jgi:hypothetical protein
MQIDIRAVECQVETIFAQLQARLTQGDAVEKRDAASAAYEELEVLRQQVIETESDAESTERPTIESLLTGASRKAWSLYEAYHQELQHQLEWASTRDYE